MQANEAKKIQNDLKICKTVHTAPKTIGKRFENYPKKNANNSKTAPRILLIFYQNQVQGLYYRYQSNLEKVIIAFSSNNFFKSI